MTTEAISQPRSLLPLTLRDSDMKVFLKEDAVAFAFPRTDWVDDRDIETSQQLSVALSARY